MRRVLVLVLLGSGLIRGASWLGAIPGQRTAGASVAGPIGTGIGAGDALASRAIGVAAAFGGLPAELLEVVEVGENELLGVQEARVRARPPGPSGLFIVDVSAWYVRRYELGAGRISARRPLLLPDQGAGPVRSADEATTLLGRWLERSPAVAGGRWVADARPSGEGLAYWSATWVAEIAGVRRHGCTVEIRIKASDGDLVHYTATLPRPDSSPAPAAITDGDAVGIARRHCTLDPGYALAGVALGAYPYLPPGERRRIGLATPAVQERMFYRVEFDGLRSRTGAFGRPATYLALRQVVLVDGVDGTVDGEFGVVERPSPSDTWQSIARRANPHMNLGRPQTVSVEDRRPAAGGDQLVLFTTSRGGPFEREMSTLALWQPGGRVQLVVREIPTWGPLGANLAPAGDRLAFAHKGIVYELDLRTGALRRHTRADRPGAAPAFHPNGKWLAIQAVRSTYDQDVYLVDTARSLTSVRGQQRVARMDGVEALPAFRPDGKLLVFAHQPPGNDLGPWELWAADLGDAFAQVTNVRKLVGELPEPGGISWSPSGRWLLWRRLQPPECALPAWFRIDPAAGTQEPLPVPELADPELPGRKLVPFDAVLASEDEVVFAAIHWSGEAAQPGSWLIYRCGLDGGNLRRLTPLTDEAEVYRFPDTGAEAPVFQPME